jgi:phosphatidylserine/phosphatidylglycerophosphate/cardiolipin synthase-like enzyme
MLRRAGVLIIAVVTFMPLLGGTAAAYDPTYDPGQGPSFNQPQPKGNADVYQIARHIVAAIRNVPGYVAPEPGVEGPARPEIKIATYSHDLQQVTDELISAYRRGVSVQMVLNDNWTSDQTRQLMRVLGRDRSAPSFVHVCDGACRGAGTVSNQHAKMYLFSETGAARNVVMTGSANTTEYAAKVHWNDLFTVKDAPNLYDVYHKVFEQMKVDDGSPNGYLPYEADGYDGYFFPKYGFTKADDPVLDRLNKVNCDAPGGGINGHTAIRVAMYAWSGDRGLWIAEKMAQLQRRGCKIRALVSNQGRVVLRELKSAGITVRSGSLNLNGRLNDGFENSGFEVFVHEKWMALNGTFDGSLGRHVWTGSDNWSDLSNNNDEATIHVRGAGYYNRYMDNYGLIWSSWSRPL